MINSFKNALRRSRPAFSPVASKIASLSENESRTSQQVTPPVMPGVPSPAPVTPTVPIPQLPTTPIYQPIFQEGPPPVMSSDYIPGFLTSIIGRTVRAEFIIGTNQFIDKTGVLVDVGVNFFVLQDPTTRNYVMCDLYSVKFVTILS